MPEPVPALVKGTLDLLILRTLELQPLHGAALADRIFQTTRGAFQVKAGSLFPALHRLEQDGWIKGRWEPMSSGHRVRSYTLTGGGRRHVSAEREAWDRVVAAMSLVLDAK